LKQPLPEDKQEHWLLTHCPLQQSLLVLHVVSEQQRLPPSSEPKHPIGAQQPTAPPSSAFRAQLA
jgi:hypothetical protein